MRTSIETINNGEGWRSWSHESRESESQKVVEADRVLVLDRPLKPHH